MNMEKAKYLFLKLLKKSSPKALVMAVSFFVMIILTSISLVKIHSTGGMAKAMKDAEIAYNYAVEKDNKTKIKKQDDNSSALQTDVPAVQTDEQREIAQTYALSDEQLAFVNDYYGKSAFVGDSVMLGFSKYCEQKGEEFLGGPLFLVAGSFSLKNALSNEEDAVLPTFKGEKMKVEEAIDKAENIDKVFLFFGINDFNVVDDPINDVFAEYVQLIGRILEKKSVQINVVSTSYILYGKDYKSLTNENIKLLNDKMQKYCEVEGYGFVNVADATGDWENGLKQEYCSDGYLHQNELAYGVWSNILQNFALYD